jgi:hypothetical protein
VAFLLLEYYTRKCGDRIRHRLRGGVLIGSIRLRQQGISPFFLPDFCPQGKNLEEMEGKGVVMMPMTCDGPNANNDPAAP